MYALTPQKHWHRLQEAFKGRGAASDFGGKAVVLWGPVCRQKIRWVLTGFVSLSGVPLCLKMILYPSFTPLKCDRFLQGFYVRWSLWRGDDFFYQKDMSSMLKKLGAIWPLLEKQILEALQRFSFSLHFKRFPATSSVYQTALRMKHISPDG